MGDILDAILSVAKGIAKAGLGDDIVTGLAYNESKVARNIAESKALNKFNGLGGKATKEIKMKIGDTEKIIKQGDSVFANNNKELNELMNKPDIKNLISFDHITDATAKGQLDTAWNDFRTGYGKYINGGATTDPEFMKFIGREGKDTIGVKNAISGYLGDEDYGSMRKKAVIGGTAGTMVGLRYLQGGNLTTKANGERDIAGIPFI